MLTLLAPMAPHVSAELWERRHRCDVAASPKLARGRPGTHRDRHTHMIAQINGKVRLVSKSTLASAKTKRNAWRSRTICYSCAGRCADQASDCQTSSHGQHHHLMARPPLLDLGVGRAPRFDRPEVEVVLVATKEDRRRPLSGSRIVVQIPARLRGREREAFVDDLVERLLTQRPRMWRVMPRSKSGLSARRPLQRWVMANSVRW